MNAWNPFPKLNLQAHVARIAACPSFAKSARLRGLLHHTVTESLADGTNR
jgi:hypothetical protein